MDMKLTKRKLPKSESLEPIECDTIPGKEFEDTVKETLLSQKPKGQHSENREPALEELNQKFKLERRQ